MSSTIKLIKGKVVIEDSLDTLAIAQLKKYRTRKIIELWRVKLPDLLPIAQIDTLEELYLYKTKIADYTALKNLPMLRYLFLNGVVDNDYLTIIPDLKQLQSICFANMPKLSLFPNLGSDSKLTYIKFWNCKSLINISSLAQLPHLEEVVFADTPQKPEDLIFLFKCNSIKYISAHFPSQTDNDSFGQLLKTYKKLQYRV